VTFKSEYEDPTKCPICGEPNQCAMEVSKAIGKPQEPCWCLSVVFLPELLAQIPAEARQKACVCEKCATKP
jgi:hypothetical protein